jgi:hypothetical protein
MNVVETIQAVRSAGGMITVEAGYLSVESPAELPDAVWESLRLHKPVLLELLAPRSTYADLARHEEREAIQAEAQAPADAVAIGRPRAARRCRLIRDTPWQSPSLGTVTFPAGLEGYVVDDPNEIEDPLERLALAWILKADRAAGKATIPVLLDGRARVLEASSVLAIPEGEPSHE